MIAEMCGVWTRGTSLFAALTLLAVFATPVVSCAQTGAMTAEEAVRLRQDLEALAELEARVTKLYPRLAAATVGLRFQGGQGSGVIISADGYVLTAAHIFDDPGAEITIILEDGREVKGETLGRQEAEDFALIRITEKGAWPFAEMGTVRKLREGTMVLTTGHPGGFRKGRPPVLRLGHVTSLDGPFVETTCIIDRGDSGGPVWDLDGRVVGIHSRIQIRPRSNFHVAIDKYRTTWERLVSGESWGNRPRGDKPRFDSGPRLGVRVFPHEDGVIVDRAFPDLPAAKGGVRRGDVITHVAGEKVKDPEGFVAAIRKNKAGDEIVLDIVRTGRGEDAKPSKMKIVVTLDEAP